MTAFRLPNETAILYRAAPKRRAFTANDLRESLHEHEVSHEDYSWYIQMKETTVLQTSGFGMGIERFLLWLTATEDIRNLTILLRDNEHEYIP